MKYLRIAALCIAGCAWGLAAPSGAQDWKMSAMVSYDTGKYGTSDHTSSFYIPLTLKRYFDKSSASVTVPYLRQSSTGQVVRVGGSPVRVNKVRTAAGSSSQSGLGDIILRGGYPLRQEDPDSFGLTLAGRIKLPTADEDKGLGTGEFDEGAGLEFAKEIAPRLTLLADGYYTLIGEPDGADFNNQLSLDLGFYSPLNGKLGLTVLYETSNAIVSGNPGPRDLSATLDYKAPDGYNYFGGLLLGLSDGSPDFGISAGLSRRF